MKQHAAAVAFPAASVVIIAVWITGLYGLTVPGEVASAATAILAWAAVKFGLSRDQPPIDPVTSQQEGPPRRTARRRG